MFYLLWFTLCWIFWLSFANKARWREILPVCIFAKCLALATDVLMFYYPLWEYIGPIIEMIYLKSGHIRYHQWWNNWYSYASDWLLYWLFYKYHVILKLERLSLK
ncbi:MAG: hypothetical protein H6Q75_917 [Firmicutes bacterium]|nr:hypothetical protein [Bacillota bacterium]